MQQKWSHQAQYKVYILVMVFDTPHLGQVKKKTLSPQFIIITIVSEINPKADAYDVQKILVFLMW